MSHKLSFFQKLALCWKYPFFYLLIVTSVNVFAHYHSNYLADKINPSISANQNPMKRSKSLYNFAKWFRFQHHFFVKNTVFVKSWMKENMRLLRSIFAFNHITEFYIKKYNGVHGVDNIYIFDFLKNMGESTMESSWGPLYRLFWGENIFLYTPMYSFIIFLFIFSSMIRRWQFLSFLEKTEDPTI